MKAFRNTMLGGLVLLLLAIVVSIVIGKAFQISMSLTSHVAALLHQEGVAGITLTHLVAALSIIAACYWVGWLARHPSARKGIYELDDTSTEFLPGYMFLKITVTSVTHVQSTSLLPQPAATK